MSDPRRTLVGVFEERLRLRHFSPRTIEAYVRWVRRFVRFHRGRHPRDMGEREVTAFLSSLGLLGSFEDTTRTIVEQLRTLTFSTRRLRAARDLLLPRLMSGQLMP